MKYLSIIILFFPLITSANESICYGTTSNGHLDGGVELPTNPFNRFGYDIEFNANGIYETYSIDYEAMAAHIVALHKQAKADGHNLWRVIFDPSLQAGLLRTQYGSYLKKHIQFSKKRSWVRHDEHYHIDFSISCR